MSCSSGVGEAIIATAFFFDNLLSHRQRRTNPLKLDLLQIGPAHRCRVDADEVIEPLLCFFEPDGKEVRIHSAPRQLSNPVPPCNSGKREPVGNSVASSNRFAAGIRAVN